MIPNAKEMICPMFGVYRVEKYLFIGIVVKNRKIISTEIITAVARCSLSVYTMQ